MSEAADRPEQDMLPAIETIDLGWRVGQRWVLRGLMLQVPEGMLAGLAGANGAGKSALLRLLASLSRPSQGSIRILGWETTAHASAVRARVGYLSEQSALYEHLTVLQNLDFVARIHGLDKAARAEVVQTLLNVVGLAEQARTLVATLSDGERRRAALAAAVVHDPPVLLLDDPLRGLDGIARLEQMEVLRELHGMGKTIVVAGNLLADLAALCDEILVLDQGTLTWRGNPADLAGLGEPDEAQPAGTPYFDRLLTTLVGG